MNLQERKELYKKALKHYKSIKRPEFEMLGLCSLLCGFLDMPLYLLNMEHRLPELYSQRPEVFIAYWYPRNEHGLNMRVAALEAAIKLCNNHE